MTMESAREAPGEGRAGSPTGFRRLTPSLLRADRAAEGFDGLPGTVDGVTGVEGVEGVPVPILLVAATVKT